jgi:hypothetical protein
MGNSPCSAAILLGDTLSLLRDNRDELRENFRPCVRDGVGDGVRLGVGGREFRRDDFRGLGLGFWTRDSRRRISAVRWDCVV